MHQKKKKKIKNSLSTPEFKTLAQTCAELRDLKYNLQAKLSLYCILSNPLAPVTYRPAKWGTKFLSWPTKEIVQHNSGISNHLSSEE